MADYLTLNKANWDDRAPAHAASPDYAVERFLTDPSHLSDVVRFERAEPQVWEDSGTYVETDAVLAHATTHQWNHGLGEIVAALLAAGMTLTGLTEHDSAPWQALPGLMTAGPDGEWRLADRPWRLPCTFTLQAVRAGR